MQPSATALFKEEYQLLQAVMMSCAPAIAPEKAARGRNAQIPPRAQLQKQVEKRQQLQLQNSAEKSHA